jgi:peptidyl-prolyl cis-trans isomerase D
MISLMRRYRRTLQIGLLFVIAAFVATSVFVFGANSLRGEGNGDMVAKVNGETIPTERYQRRYREFLEMYAQMFRDRFTPEMVERLGLGQQVVDDLVQEAVVVQRARAERLDVSDEELNAQIHAIPAFQEGGRFSLKRYEDVLRRIGLTKTAFEEDARRRLTRMKTESMVRNGIKVSDAEIEQAFVHTRTEVKAAWALVDLAPIMAGINVPDEELETYVKGHQAEFREPERRRVQYVVVSPRDFTKPVTDAEVEKYYSEHGAEFETPREVQAAHVLVRVGETGGSEAEDKARAKVADVIKRAKAGEDFAKLAREISEDPGSAKNGGDLGFVKKGEMVPQFEQALFALKKGELTAEPVRSPFGFHAIKAGDVREGGKKLLKDVAGPISERLQTEAADRVAKARADEVRVKLQAAADFNAEARTFGLTPVEAKIARRSGGGNPFAPPDPIEENAFALSVGGVSVPVKSPAGWMVLKNVESIPPGVPPMAEIKGKVVAAIKREKADALALERARQVTGDAKSVDVAAAARKAGASTGETGRFSRAKPAEKLPGDVQLAALGGVPGTVTDPVKTPQGYYVLKVLERVPPDLGTLSQEREKISQELLSRKQTQAWQAWVTAARSRAKIEVSPKLPVARRG